MLRCIWAYDQLAGEPSGRCEQWLEPGPTLPELDDRRAACCRTRSQRHPCGRRRRRQQHPPRACRGTPGATTISVDAGRTNRSRTPRPAPLPQWLAIPGSHRRARSITWVQRPSHESNARTARASSTSAMRSARRGVRVRVVPRVRGAPRANRHAHADLRLWIEAESLPYTEHLAEIGLPGWARPPVRLRRRTGGQSHLQACHRARRPRLRCRP